MKNIKIILFAFFLAVLNFAGCAAPKERIVGAINGTQITERELEIASGEPKPVGKDIENCTTDPEELASTRKALLREALKTGINKDHEFRNMLEKYWEQALISVLVKRKAEELKKTITVDDGELKEYAMFMGSDVTYEADGKITKLCCQDIGPKFAKQLLSMKPGEVKRLKKGRKSVIVRMVAIEKEPHTLELHWQDLKALVLERKRAEAMDEWIGSLEETAVQ